MDKKKIIILIIAIIIIIGIIVINNIGTENENVQNDTGKRATTSEGTTENKNVITGEEITEKITEKVKEKLENTGLILEDRGMALDNNLLTEGNAYKVYLNKDETEGDEIQIYRLNADTIRKIGPDVEDGELKLENETYWKSGNVIIKLSENDEINQKIKDAMK